MKRNAQITQRIFHGAAALVVAALILGCQLPLLGSVDEPANGLAPGSISIDLGREEGRTLLPDVASEIVAYDVTVSSTSGMDSLNDQTGFPVVFSGLVADTWQVGIDAKDAGGAIVATGFDTVTINPGDTEGKVITVDIAPTSSGTGTIDITLEWPADTVDNISASIKPEFQTYQNIGFTMAGDGLSARYTADWPAGNYTLIAPLFKNGNEYASVIEAVQVYDNLTTAAVITLTAADLTGAPQAPSDVTVYKQTNGDFVVDWIDVANTETYYRIERTVGAGSPTVIENALPAGTETYIDSGAAATSIDNYTIRVSAGNGFGDSPWVTATVAYPEISVAAGGFAKSSGSTAYFGQVDTGATETITIQIDNTGPAELSLAPPSLSGTDASDFSLDTAGMLAAVASGSSTSFDVVFAPTTIGTKNAAITITNNDQDETDFVLNLNGIGYHPYIYVSPSGNDTTGTGDKTAPYETIGKGIDQTATNGWTVRVAEGTYQVDGASAPITIADPMTLEGGYDATTWQRDIATNATIIEDVSTTDRDGSSPQNYPQTPVLVENIMSGSTVITLDGFTIQGAPSGTAAAGVAVYNSYGTLVIRNCDITGGNAMSYSYGVHVRRYADVTIASSIVSGGSADRTYGIYGIEDATLDLSDSTVDGGVATTSSYGISVNGYATPGAGSSLTASGNTIYGGRALHVYGIWFGIESTGTVSDNDIDGGDSNVADGSAYGVYVYDRSDPTIEGNYIYSGDADPDVSVDGDDEGVSEAVRIDDASHPVIRNNVIVAGSSENTRGISISAGIDGTKPASNPLIYNNTIDAGLGNSSGASGGPAWGIAIENTGATIKNNMIYVHGSGTSNYGIDVVHDGNATGTPTIEHNYVYVGGGFGDQTRSAILYVGVGNNVTGGAAPGFTAYIADNDPTNDDYTLTDGSPVDVRGGGTDLTSDGVSVDYTGASRTTTYDTSAGSVSNGGSGWSMGAYEFDS